MYVKTYITLTDAHGDEEDYEVGADVSYIPGDHATRAWARWYEVGEPDISAPGCTLDDSRIAHDPQGGEVLEDGWSDRVEEALTDAYIAGLGEDDGPDPDEYDDIYANRDDGDYMKDEG